MRTLILGVGLLFCCGCYNLYLPSTPLSPCLSPERENALGISGGPAYGFDAKGANLVVSSFGVYYELSYRPKFGRETWLISDAVEAGLLWSFGPTVEVIAGAGAGHQDMHVDGSDPLPFDNGFPGFTTRTVNDSKAFVQLDLMVQQKPESELVLAMRVERARLQESGESFLHWTNDSSRHESYDHAYWATVAIACATYKARIDKSSAFLVGSFGPSFALSTQSVNPAWILGLGIEWHF